MDTLTAEEKFWLWFLSYETELFDFEVDQERIFDALAAELQKINPELTFEFGPKEPKRDFVISAGGIKSAFPAVVSLRNTAPALERWNVIAFRPRRNPVNTVEFKNKRVDPLEVEFSLLDNGQMAGLHLYIPGLRDDDADYKMIGYLLLDETLGEYDVETGVGLIKMLPFDEKTSLERHPLAQLPALFDQLTSHLRAQTGRPS
jgi:hypothetical protein